MLQGVLGIHLSIYLSIYYNLYIMITKRKCCKAWEGVLGCGSRDLTGELNYYY